MAEEPRMSIRGKRALIVEEEFYSRWYLRRVLAPYTRCDVVVRGEEAVDVFRLSVDSGTPYALVLLDLRLPEMNGDAVLREIRRIEKRNKKRTGNDRTKVLLITADGDAAGVPQQLLRECEGWIGKPITKGEILKKLHSLGLISV